MNKCSKKIIYISAWAIFFVLFTALTVKGIFNNLDRTIADAAAIYTNPILDRLFSLSRSLGDINICILLALAVSIYAFFNRSKKIAIFSLLVFILLLGAGHGLKNVIRRERPPNFYQGQKNAIKSFSYPSGHSLRTSYLFFVLAMLAGKTKLSEKTRTALRGVCYGLIILIGVSSIYLRAHWLSDVIGAYILGYTFSLVLSCINPRDYRSSQSSPCKEITIL